MATESEDSISVEAKRTKRAYLAYAAALLPVSALVAVIPEVCATVEKSLAAFKSVAPELPTTIKDFRRPLAQMLQQQGEQREREALSGNTRVMTMRTGARAANTLAWNVGKR